MCSITKKDTVKKFEIDILGKKLGEVKKYGEPLSLLPEKKLNIKDNWLIVSSAEGESRVPVSDIYSLVIENCAAMLSVSVLTTLTQAGAHIILCDEKHLPVSATLPINTHYRPFNVIKKQIDMTYEFKNLLWQIVAENY